MKIIIKLTLAFLTVALLVLIVGYFSAHRSQKILQETIGESSVILAQETIDKIDRTIYYRIERWISYSYTNPRLEQTLLSLNQEFEKLDNIQAYINQKDREWVSQPKEKTIPFMEQLINNKLAQRLRERMDFYAKKEDYKIFGEIFITNKYGANVAQTGKTSDYYQADEKWWQNAKEDGLYVEDVSYDKSTCVYSVAICVRIDDENGNFLGVMKAVLNIEDEIDIIKELELSKEYKTMDFKLITKDGKIIYSTEEYEDIPHGRHSKFTHEGKHLNYFISEGDKPGEKEELFVHAHSKGYKDYKGLGWILVVEYETKEIFAPVFKLRNTLLFISFIAAVSAVVLGFVVSRSISRPIAKLKSKTLEIGKGNLNADIRVESNDEIGELANSFKKMTGDLQKTTVSKDYIDNIIGSMIDALVVVTPEKIKTVNKATSDLLGYKEEELIGKDISFLFPEEEEERIPLKGTSLEKLIKEGYLTNYEISYKAKDGKKIPILLSGSVMKDNNNNIISIVCMARDITKRKKAEENLRFYGEIIANMSEGVYAIRASDGVIIYTNPKFDEIFGYGPGELIGKHVSIVNAPTDKSPEEKTKEITEVLNKKDMWRGEICNIKKDGTHFWCYASVSIIEHSEHGNIWVTMHTDITERKAAEEVLRTSEAQLANAMQIARLGGWEYDVASDLFTFNDHFYAIFRTTADKVGGYTMSPARYSEVFLHPDDKAVVGIEMKKALETTDPHFSRQLEHRIIYADGNIGWISVRFFIVKDDQGRTVKTYGANQDITDRKKAEEEIKREKERTEQYLNIAEIGIAVINADESIVLINKKGCKSLGYKKEELIGRNWFNFLIPQRIREEVRGVFGKLMAGEIEPVEYYENPLLTKDGEERLFAFHNTVIREPGGQIAGALFSADDITERKQAEKALQDSEGKYRTLLENLPQKIFLKDKNLVYISCNDNYARDLRIKSEEIVGKTDYEFYSKELTEKYRADDKRIIDSGNTEDIEEKYIIDGQEMFVHTVKTPVKDEGGKVIGILGVFWDITERKKAEKEKERLQRQLIQSEKMASLGEIAAGIAHELNTPLNVILGYQELLQKRIDADSPYQEYLRIAIEEVEQCRQLIHDFMTYARPSAPENLEIKSVNIAEVLRSSLKLLTLHKIQNIKLHLDINECIPPVAGDQKQIMQVFVNLINNAVQAMPKGGDVSIVVKHNGEGVEFRVCDTGEGIPEENITKVFDPFFTTKRPGKGTGLGLAVCQRIIENHKGTVRIESELGKGTTVIGELPALKQSRKG